MGKKLVTLDEFKTYKEINNDEHNSKIGVIISSINELVKTYCNRTFLDYATVDKTEYFDATSISEYYMDELPLLSVTSFSVSNDGGVTYTEGVENTDYFVDTTNNCILTGSTLPFTTSSIPFKSGKIIYKGGYIEVPMDLKIAIMDLIEYYREEEYTPRKAFQGMSVENLGFREGAGSALPTHIRRVFELYRVVM